MGVDQVKFEGQRSLDRQYSALNTHHSTLSTQPATLLQVKFEGQRSKTIQLTAACELYARHVTRTALDIGTNHLSARRLLKSVAFWGLGSQICGFLRLVILNLWPFWA